MLPPATMSAHGIVLPWESLWAGLVLGPRRGAAASEEVAPMPPVPLPLLHWQGPTPPAPPKAAPMPQPTPKVKAGPEGRRPTAGHDGVRPDEDEDIARNLAVGKWRVIVAAAAHCCDEALVDPAVSDEDRLRSLQDALRTRTTPTLNKRAGSILLYLRWGRAKGYTDGELLPFLENTAYSYARDLFDDRAPATRASSFVEAAFVASSVLGLASDDLQASARLKGAVYGSFQTKRLTVKQDPLTAAAVISLEMRVLDPNELVCDRVFAGFAAWCVHTRQRVGDASRVIQEPWLDPSSVAPCEASFIEAVGGKTKAGNVKRRRRLQLPLVGLACGLTGEAWAATWLSLRREHGLDAATDGTMMPAPRRGGGWAKRSLTTSEFSDWLRMLTREAVPEEEGTVSYSAHSCKATVLSWAAKAGMPKPARRLLGSHAKPGDRTVAEYSRDEMAEPLRLVSRMFAWMADKQFDPDANRSGRWLGGRLGPEWYPCVLAVPPQEDLAPAAQTQDDEGPTDGDSSEFNTDAAPGDASVPGSPVRDGPSSPDHVFAAFNVNPEEQSPETGDMVRYDGIFKDLDNADAAVEDFDPFEEPVFSADSSDGSDHAGGVEGEDRLEEELVALAASSLPVDASGARLEPSPGKPLPKAGLFQHDPSDKRKARLTLHCGCPENPLMLRCRRAQARDDNQVYVRLDAWPAFHGGECRTCMPAEARAALTDL